MTEEPILQMGTDKLIPRHVYDKPFTVTFPERSEWKDGFQPDRKRGLLSYADGSKTNKGTGAGVFGYGTRQKLSFSLGNYNIVFPGEMYAIKEWLFQFSLNLLSFRLYKRSFILNIISAIYNFISYCYSCH
jgi:hypothetical protein